ncbi:hypothetical protein Tco_0382453 [Tanacetum coccineum]
MHNNIVVGSRDRPPMLATGRYAQWQSHFLRYIDTRPNGDALRKCILEGPYQLTTVTIPAVPATENFLAVPERTVVETLLTMSPENKAHYESKKEAIHLLLTGIGDEIYSTYQKEVNEIRVDRIAKNANPLALVATAQQYPNPYYQAPKSYKSYAPPSKQSSSTRSNASTKFKGKEIANPISPPSESASVEDNDPKQAQRDKDMQKNLALVVKYFKKICKPTNNNLRTSSNSRNKNVDTTPRYKNENQTGQFRNQRTMTVVGAKETVGSQEKMLLYKQAEKGVPLQVEQADWLEDTDEEIDEQELEAHYSFMAKIHEVPNADSGTYTEPLEQWKRMIVNVTPDSPNMCDNDIQTEQNAKDERAVLANLIANLKLDVDENKKIQKQLKKANASLAHELKECKSILAETSRTLGESNIDYDKLELVKEKHDELVKHSLLSKSHFEGIVKEKTKVITNLKLKEEKDIDKMISMEKQLKFLNEIVYKRNQSIQSIHMLAPKGLTFNGRPTFANPMYLKMDQSKKPCLYEIPNNQSDPANRLVPDREETRTLENESRSKLNKDLVRPYDYTKLNSLYEIFKPASQEYHEQLAHENEVRKKMWRKELVDQAWEKHSHNHFRALTALDMEYVESLENEIDELESDKAEFSNMYDIVLQECVSNDVMCSYLHSLSDLYAHSEFQCLYLHKVKECECFAQKLSKQTESVSKEVYTELLKSFAKLEKHSISLEPALQQCQEQMKNDTVCKEKASNLKKLIEKCKGKSMETKFDKPFVVRQPNAQRIPKPSVLGKPAPFSDSLERKSFSQTKPVPKTNVSESLSKSVTTQILPQTTRQALRSTQIKDEVVPNNSHVKDKKTEVEDHLKISSISNKTKSVTTCNDSLKSRTSNDNAVCATCEKCLVDSDHFACVTKILNDVNARIKKPNVVPVSTRKPKIQANKFVATPPRRTVASESTIQNSKSYYKMLYEKTSKAWKWWIEQQCLSGYKWVPNTKSKWVPKAKNENVKERVSFAIDNVSRITNVLKLTNSLGSKLLSIPSFSNSLADCSNHPIHC